MPDDRSDSPTGPSDAANRPGTIPASLIELLRGAAAGAPDTPVILAPGRDALTLGGLLALVERTVAEFQARGLFPGHRIVVALPPSVETLAAYYALATGVAGLPLSPDLTADDYVACIDQIKAEAVVVQHGHPSRAREAAQRRGIALIEFATVTSAPAGTFEIVGSASTRRDGAVRFAAPDDLTALIHTSGTTGVPKIVPRFQREMLSHFGRVSPALRASQGVSVITQPLHRIGGIAPLIIAIATGSCVACPTQFTAAEVYRHLALYRPRTLNAVPAMLAALVREAHLHEDELRQFQLESIAVGAAALPEALYQEVQRLFGATVQIGYGMTEVGPIANTTQDGETVHRPGSVGKPLPVVQVHIADAAGTPLPTGESGEIMVRSPLMFRGYFDNPEANAEAFRDGWFRTGDLGYFDADGFLYLIGRIKEMINRGGSKISPLDVETALERHPAVREAAAFGFPHAALGEDLAAAVVLADPAVAERDLRRFAADNLPLNRVPSRFVVVDELPRTALGKLRRNALAAQFADALRR